MSRYHHQHHVHEHAHVTKNLRFAFFINLCFTILEIIGGIFTNSVAILSDAIHDLGDTIAIGLSWYFENYSKKESTHKYTYGYGRFSLVSALINSTILLIGSGIIISKAIPRFIHPEEVKPFYMILFAIVGVVANGAAVFKLKKGKSLNQRVVRLHLIEDVLGWVAVLIGSIVIYYTGWLIVDPILSMMIAAYIFFNAGRNLLATFKVLLQTTPEEVDFLLLEKELQQLDNVEEAHDIHIWSLDGNYNIMSIHIVVEDNTPMPRILQIKLQARDIIRKYNINHETMQVDYKSEECIFQNCVDEEHQHE